MGHYWSEMQDFADSGSESRYQEGRKRREPLIKAISMDVLKSGKKRSPIVVFSKTLKAMSKSGDPANISEVQYMFWDLVNEGQICGRDFVGAEKLKEVEV